MKSVIEMNNMALFALGVLSILTGMLLFELLYLVEQLPAWGLLVPFFSAGVVYKVIEQVQQSTLARRFAPRVVTVEFDWPLVS